MDLNGLPVPSEGSNSDPLSDVVPDRSSGRSILQKTSPPSQTTASPSILPNNLLVYRAVTPQQQLQAMAQYRRQQYLASTTQHLRNHPTNFNRTTSGDNYQPLLGSPSDQRVNNKVPRLSYLMRNPSSITQAQLTRNEACVSVYRPGRGAERLREYVIHQKNRPKENNIQFWRKLVAEFFAPTATKRWCMSCYKDTEELHNVFKVTWNCGNCLSNPCYGFEVNEELLARVHQVKYDIGILDEQLQLHTPIEYRRQCGQIIVQYHRVTLESEYSQARIVHHGQLRVVFSPDFKIISWEFCAKGHKEYIDRTTIIPPACQLEAAMKNYQHAAQNPYVTPEELQKHRDEFILSAGQMLETLGTPLISQTGLPKPYGQCIQMYEVLSVMHDLIAYSQEHELAQKENLAKFPNPATNVPSGKYLSHHFQQHQSSTISVTQTAHTEMGKSGNRSAAENVHMEPKTSASMQQPYQLNFDDDDDFCGTVDKIIHEVTTDLTNKRVVGISDTGNEEGNMVSVIDDFGNDTWGSNAVTSNRIEDIDDENYTKEIGTTSRAQMDEDIFPYEFIDFGDLNELLQ